jgi:hypothetical protein
MCDPQQIVVISYKINKFYFGIPHPIVLARDVNTLLSNEEKKKED